MAKVTIHTTDGNTKVIRTKPDEDLSYYDDLPFTSSNVLYVEIES